MRNAAIEAIVRGIRAAGESYYAEFKSAWDFGPAGKRAREPREIATDIGQTLVAFSNADGGDLLVGVEDSGEITGVPHQDDQVRYLLQAPTNQVMGGAALGVQVHDLQIDGHRVLLFRVPEYAGDPVVTSDGRCLIRKQAQSVPIPPKEIERRRRHRIGDVGYEAEPVPLATLDDLDMGAVRAAPRRGTLPPNDETLLQYWNLVDARNGHLVLRRAALLLFAKDPLRWHPNNRVRIRHVHQEQEGFGRRLGTREIEVPGPISSAIPQTVMELRRRFESEDRVGSLFATTQLLPEDAVEEAVVNAVVHRNYAIEGQAVEIQLFPERVEFKSPGVLPEPITLADLRRQAGIHRTRNPLIMRVMRDLGWTRDQGEGIRRIFGAMRQVELHEPELEIAGDTFVVRLSTRSIYDESTRAWIASYGPFGLQPAERKFVIVLRKHGGKLSIDRLGRHMDLPFDAVKRALSELERRGIVWHARKSRSYHLVEPLNVPSELALRRFAQVAPIHAEARLTVDQIRAAAGIDDQRTLVAFTDRMKESGVLTPAGSGRFRFGESLLHYAASMPVGRW